MRRYKVLSTGLTVIAVFLIVSTSEAKKVRLAIPSYSMSMVVFAVARDKGYYQQEGLEVEFVLMRDEVATPALIGGNVEFSGLGAGPIPAILRGAPLRFLFTTWVKPFFSIHARPGIANVKDLKGKKIAIAGFGSGPALLVRELLQRNGLDAERHVGISIIPSGPDSVNALIVGAVDAAMLSIPFNLTAEEKGFPVIVSFLEEDWAVQLQGGIAVREALLQDDPETAEKFVRGTLKGLLYARHDRAGTIQIAGRFLKIREEVAAKLYDLIRPTMTADGTASEQLQRKVLVDAFKLLGLKGTPPSLANAFDYSLVKKAHGELEEKRWRP